MIRLYTTGETPPSEALEALLDLPWLARCDSASLSLICALIEMHAGKPSSAHTMELYSKLLTAKERGVVFSRGWMFFVPRLLGLAAAHNQWWDQAEAHFRHAIITAGDIDARPERGRTCLDYARMLLARNASTDRGRALELVQKARSILDDLSMAPFVRQADQIIETLNTP